MIWGGLAESLKWLLGSWVILLALYLTFCMVSGRILLSGLLSLEKHAPFGMDRLQLLVVTLLFAGGYTLVALNRDGGDLPEVPMPLLLILAGSNGAYLSVKYAALAGGAGGRR